MEEIEMNLTEAIGKAIMVLGVFLTGMSTTILLEKFQKIPSTCQVTPDVYSKYGGTP